MNLNLKGKIVLISASATGLGKGIAEGFLKEEAIVVITDINNDHINSTLSEFSAKYNSDNIHSFHGDLSDESTIAECIDTIIAKLGKIDILIANLGSGRGVQDWKIEESEWDRMMDLNFNAARRLINHTVDHMPEDSGSSIVFISSIAGKEVIGAPMHYSVAKSALIAYSTNLSKKLAQRNIRVNSICPGNIFFKEGTWDIKLKENRDGVLDMLDKTVPLSRFATPEEIGNIVVFLTSEKASFITGSCIVADGGQTVGLY
jgi:3-oxoacyl-[acyl-carrier protein] reductase